MIFDTNILIYVDRGNNKARNLILKSDNREISAVTYMEYVPYCQNAKELKIFHHFLESLHFNIIEINSEISLFSRQLVKQYALSHSMEMGDAIIAATAIVGNNTICSSNLKHFRQIDNLDIKHFKP